MRKSTKILIAICFICAFAMVVIADTTGIVVPDTGIKDTATAVTTFAPKVGGIFGVLLIILNAILIFCGAWVPKLLSILNKISTILKEISDVQKAGTTLVEDLNSFDVLLAQALADGNISPEEAEQLKLKANQLKTDKDNFTKEFNDLIAMVKKGK